MWRIVQLRREDSGRTALDQQGQDALKVRLGARRRSVAARWTRFCYFAKCGAGIRLYRTAIYVTVRHSLHVHGPVSNNPRPPTFAHWPSFQKIVLEIS